MFATVGAMGAGGEAHQLLGSGMVAAAASFRNALLNALCPKSFARPPPPSAFGAVLIAAVGVYGVFKMAFWVAGETGRSLNPEHRPTSQQ